MLLLRVNGMGDVLTKHRDRIKAGTDVSSDVKELSSYVYGDQTRELC